LKTLSDPSFEKKDYGQGAGIPVLKTIWDLFDLSLLFSQLGFLKHSGLAPWLLAFAYICGLIGQVNSANHNAKYSTDAPFLQQLLSGKTISQSAFSRFLSTPFKWFNFSLEGLSAYRTTRIVNSLTEILLLWTISRLNILLVKGFPSFVGSLTALKNVMSGA
jgi:hypothetical protein